MIFTNAFSFHRPWFPVFCELASVHLSFQVEYQMLRDSFPCHPAQAASTCFILYTLLIPCIYHDIYLLLFIFVVVIVVIEIVHYIYSPVQGYLVLAAKLADCSLPGTKEVLFKCILDQKLEHGIIYITDLLEGTNVCIF